MSCFGGRVSQDLYQNCCNANTICEFNGDIDSLKSEPIYVQKVFDAVLFNLQGMKTCLLYTSPGERKLIPTGLFVELPPGVEAQVRARSGLSIKHGIGLVNGVGTVDSDYQMCIRDSLWCV